MPEPTNTKTKEFKCGQTVFMLAEGAIKETKIVYKNILESFSPAEKVETVVEYFVEGKIKVEPELLFPTKGELIASL